MTTTTGTMAPRPINTTGLPSSLDEVVDRARTLRPELEKDAHEIDAKGVDPTRNMRLISEAGINAINVPAELGGLWTGPSFGGWKQTIDTLSELSAADGSTGQCWVSSTLVAREIFAAHELPVSTREQIAKEYLFEGRRFVASNAETGGTGRVIGRHVDGGIIVSGVKTFNTNSGGGGRDFLSVSFSLLSKDGNPDNGTRHHALIRIDDPAIAAGHDWDNMGQRGTYSQTIEYKDVFVPDGWHFPAHVADPYFFCAAMLLHAGLLQGIGEGAYAAAINFIKQLNRPSMPKFETATNDPLIHRQLGDMSTALAASRALMLAVAEELEAPERIANPEVMAIKGFRAKVASTTAGMEVSSRIHDLTGARSTSNKFRLDRFWRNARTFGSHDSIDSKNAFIGAFDLAGQLPAIPDYIRI
ncbi:acyl-CoA dehydrogenase family protein [Paenarthrobacter aurescens]|uniref:Desulfurization protein n=1 Tax=Paenarthrobacter aurescens (strain TC1) TaxID=290340 RepID=A1RDH0_PAEAT|nr:acyl-CoA dehydrogenase family protein [Paenarthrobacter aurescens]ABM10828.1 putative desulfurization protein [Paenarthrobacter aurescens TC1]